MPIQNQTSSQHKGFTLIELMVTVAIIGILASIALPSYSQYVIRARLTDGQKILSSYALAQEQYFQNNNRYATAADGTTCGVAVNGYSTTDFGLGCAATASAAAGNTYAATLTGRAKASGYTYTITHTGAKATTQFANTTKSGLSCWILKNESC